MSGGSTQGLGFINRGFRFHDVGGLMDHFFLGLGLSQIWGGYLGIQRMCGDVHVGPR